MTALGQAFLYLGGASGIASSPQILAAPTGADADFGLFVASAGDVNGDGYADVIVDRVGGAYLFSGERNGTRLITRRRHPDSRRNPRCRVKDRATSASTRRARVTSTVTVMPTS